MKKTLKGFTLIECLIAMAILGIASLTMAQIYAGVAKRNMKNHLVNTSISNQVKFAEKYSKNATAAVIVEGDDIDASTGNSSGTQYLKISEIKSVSPTGVFEIDSNKTYSYSVDVYALHTRDQGDNATTDGTVDLRYRYLIGHTN